MLIDIIIHKVAAVCNMVITVQNIQNIHYFQRNKLSSY